MYSHHASLIQRLLSLEDVRTGRLTSRVEAYDERTNTWTECKPMPEERCNMAGVVVSGKDLGRDVLHSFQHPFRDQADDSSVGGQP